MTHHVECVAILEPVKKDAWPVVLAVFAMGAMGVTGGILTLK